MTKPGQPASNKKNTQAEDSSLASVSSSYVENATFLKNFLRRFFSRAEDIEDVAQEAYLSAYRAEQERGIDEPKAYLFRVAKNMALNELNRKSRQMTVYIEDRLALIPLEGGVGVEEEIEAEQSVSLYYEAVAALPKKCRRVFLLRKVNGMRQQEIADHLGITISAVEKHLRKGTKSCRAYIRAANQTTMENYKQPLSKSQSKGGSK